MKDKLIITVVLIVIFVIAFIATTALTDAACRYNGYYKAGVEDEQGLYE